MLNRIIAFSIRNKLLIGLFVCGLIGYGIYEATRLPIDAVPDITNNQVQVITTAPSFGATDIERLVTFPIEQANSNISGLKEIRSFSRFGLSLVTIVFDDATDIYWARQQVAERLQSVQSQIPQSIGTPELGPISTGLGEIYQYVVRPLEGYENKYHETELRTIQDWVIRRQLLGVKGVAEVSSFGGKLKQYEVAVNANKLQSFQLTIQDVLKALEMNNENTGGAYIEKGPAVLFIRSEGLINKIGDIENIAVKATTGGTPVFIRDIADVKIGYATRYGAMCYNDKGEVAGAVVMMLKGANSSEVIRNVKERIKQIQKTLPQGVVIEPFLDRTKMVNNAISTVEKNLLEGALIVVFVLVLFLGNLRAGLLVASVIPLSMLFAIIMMNLFGVSGNLMSLGALDFGLIVDGAVIIVEAVMHQLSHSKKFKHGSRLDQSVMDTQVTFSAGKMMNSAVFGQIIILIVYLPIFTLQGIEGKMFKPMAQTVAFALLGAFILSLTYIPMMSALFLSRKIRHQPGISDRIMNRIERIYQSALSRILRFPKTVITGVITLFIGSLYLLSTLGGEFIPALEEGDFAVDTKVLTGSSLETTIESTRQAAGLLKKRFPEVEKVVTKIGSGEIPTDPMPMEASDMMVILKDKSEWTSAKTFPELSEKMSRALEDIPGITTGFQFPVQMRFNELISGARQDVVCKIFGENLDTLVFYAQKLAKLTGTVEGTENLFVEPVTGMPQIIIDYNRATIAQYHLSIADINRVVNTAFAGQTSGLVFEEEKRFNLVVRLAADERRSIDDVRKLLVPTPDGTQVPLYLLADISVKNGPNQIQRTDAKRRIVVGFNVKGRDVQHIVSELQQKAETGIKLPTGYYITYGGAFENLNEAKKRLSIAVPVSLSLILVLLYFAFNSLKQGLLIYTAIPLSAIGGILFLVARNMPFSISAGVGFIALFGVAVLNGIVLIAEFNRLKKEGLKNVHRIVLMGTKIRLRPVLMTAAVASLGFLPMAISNGAGAEVQRPLATVVIGGLITATFLTLFVLPVLYTLFESPGKKKKSMKKQPVVITVLLLLLLLPVVKAQHTVISIDAAIDTAMKNNALIKKEKLIAAYKERLAGSSASIPKTLVSAETGQINSMYTDTRFGVAQSFSFPTVYGNQKKLMQEEWKSAIIGVALQEKEIRNAVTILYYRLAVLKEKEKLLSAADSSYAAFQVRAANRFDKGESNLLEKTTAETQRGQIRLQQQFLQKEIETAKLEMQILMNTDAIYLPIPGDVKVTLSLQFDTTLLNAHPELQLYRQQMQIASANTALEKSQLLPDLSVAYFNSSIRGTGADNKYYTGATRFNTVQIGVGIPVFAKAQKSRVAASRINELITENNYALQQKTMQNQYRQLQQQWLSSKQSINYYKEEALPKAVTLQLVADRQLETGEINYLDWVMLSNQATTIRNSYLDALEKYNETVIRMHYLLSTK
jgi:cobalt-zinc-cadmium resistance protein CzcA